MELVFLGSLKKETASSSTAVVLSVCFSRVLQKQGAHTCVVHREEALQHELVLQVLIIHRDLRHHVTWHITGETTRLTIIEPITVFVSKHLTGAETGGLVALFKLKHERGKQVNVCVCICMLHQLTGSVTKRQHSKTVTGNRKKEKSSCLRPLWCGLNPQHKQETASRPSKEADAVRKHNSNHKRYHRAPNCSLLQHEITKVSNVTWVFFYLDNLSWYKRQLLSSRLIVGRHGSRVVRVECHKEAHEGNGHLARSLQLPFPQILRRGDPHLVGVNHNIQLQPRLHWDSSGTLDCPLGRQMAAVDRRPLLTLILISGNSAKQKDQ